MSSQLWLLALSALGLINLFALALLFRKTTSVHLMTFQIAKQINDIESKALIDHFQQGQFVRVLESELSFGAPLPAARGWAASPDFLLVIARYAQDHRPQVIVECSSGVSTIVLARVAQLHGEGHVYSLEHDPTFGEKTRQELRARGLDEWATVIEAPLIEHRIDDTTWSWYDLGGLRVDSIDQIVIDGPPYSTGPLARYPAGPLLFGKVRKGGAVFLDDADRVEETKISERWMRELPGWNVSNEYCEKGCKRFSRCES